LCGEVVTIAEPQGHDARVVRCSACGGPRQAGSLHCTFCGADFTLHERDLNTVCPACLARVSDTAKFCHYCGVRIAPESVAADETRLACPVCGDEVRLSSRQAGPWAVMECGRCVGLWLGSDTFDQLTQRAADGAAGIDESLPFTGRPTATAGDQIGPMYRKCPVCGRMMARRNFGRQSGVIIDVCRDHGVWFDADELPRILQWVRGGGLAKARETRAREAAHEERLRQIGQPTPGWGHVHEYDDVVGSSGGPVGALIDAVASWLGR
jgi:Zn-finger nucleic acid-binding protein/DNA-directed RNA polymerase subunit RPC12/RpoP